MKRIMILSILALILVALGIAVARADSSRWYGWGKRRWDHHGALAYAVHELNLNDAQKVQIKAMWQAERPAVASLLQELASESREMESATAQGNLDESKVQTIGSRQGETIAKLLIEKERFQSKIYSGVLNPKQRIKADEYQKVWHSRMDRVAERIEP